MGRHFLTEEDGVSAQNSFDAVCKSIASELAELVIAKQKDYGKQNILEFGEHGILVRSNDKFARLKNLILNSKDPQNEPIDDTLKDIAGYAIVWLMLRNGSFEYSLEEK